MYGSCFKAIDNSFSYVASMCRVSPQLTDISNTEGIIAGVTQPRRTPEQSAIIHASGKTVECAGLQKASVKSLTIPCLL